MGFVIFVDRALMLVTPAAPTVQLVLVRDQEVYSIRTFISWRWLNGMARGVAVVAGIGTEGQVNDEFVTFTVTGFVWVISSGA